MSDRNLIWTPASIERFWRAAYEADLAPVREARRLAPYLAALISVRVTQGARIVELGSRDAILASYLIRSGYRAGRLNTGPLNAPALQNVVQDPLWLGDISLTERSADVVLGADVLSRLMEDELAGWFAAARLLLPWTGQICVTTRNSETLETRLAMCPVTGKLFNGEQRLRTFNEFDLAALLEKEGFTPTGLVQAEMDPEVLARHHQPPFDVFAAESPFVGAGDTLVMFARMKGPPREGDQELVQKWIAERKKHATEAFPKPQPFSWTPSASRQFWNSIRDTPLDEQSFGAQVGRALLCAIEPWLAPAGRHLDLGAGAGDVADILAKSGYKVAALEASDGRRAGLQERLGGEPNYIGTLTTLEDIEKFDVVLASEVIEHIDPDSARDFLASIRRALKPDGVLMVSTPSNETLQDSIQYSPEADILFHRWQHVQSFSAATLEQTLRENGFVCDVIHDVDFSAVARGAAPYFEVQLATTSPQRVGKGGTLVAIARPAPLAAFQLTSARRLVQRRIARPEVYGSLNSPGDASYQEIVETRAVAALSTATLERIFALYKRLSPVLRRHMPSALKARLARFVPKIEETFAPVAQRKLADGTTPLRYAKPLLPAEAFRDGPILLVNNALAWGGVERQVVNTLLGLQQRTKHDLALICLKLSEGGDYAFYRPALSDFDGLVRDMAPIEEAKAALAETFGDDVFARLEQVIGWFPNDVQENIIRLTADFTTLRPAVVHAWQDALSIEAAFAAKLAGVPKIITSARNMSPPNFAYSRPHQRDGYREIAACGDIIMLNNSRAGAEDYAAWLGISPQRFGMIRNGIDGGAMKAPKPEAIIALRASLNIPHDAQIVGSIFRFYDEKQPMLWMQMAAEVANRVPIAHFVVFGVGPRMQEAKAFAAAHGFGDRFHAPGTISDAALGLSLLDVFVLTSKFEGTPNVVLEASCIGIPVVATPAGGTGEAVQNDVTGWVVTPPDYRVMANRVCQALGDQDFRAQCKENGPRFVEERFGLNRMIGETLALYDLTEEADRGLARDGIDNDGRGKADVLHPAPERIADG